MCVSLNFTVDFVALQLKFFLDSPDEILFERIKLFYFLQKVCYFQVSRLISQDIILFPNI